MTRRALLAFAVATLVVLAGCGGGVEVDGTPGSPTASPTDTGTPTPSLSDVTLPQGISTDGVTDTDALLAAHERALMDTSATVSMDFRLKVNGTGQNVSFAGKYTPDTDRGWMRVEFSDGTGTFYTDGGTTYKKVVQNGETTYGTTSEVSAIPDKPRFGADLRIEDALTAANWTADGVVVRDGTKLIRFVATDVTLPSSVNVSGDAEVSHEGVMLVDQDGAIHHISVRTRVESSDKTVVYSIDVRLTDIGSTTIEEPDWVEKARN